MRVEGLGLRVSLGLYRVRKDFRTDFSVELHQGLMGSDEAARIQTIGFLTGSMDGWHGPHKVAF